ncbi:MAG: hypothetical protein ACOYIT_05305 [Christensenellales bacterium]|jgi:hypothetical protein
MKKISVLLLCALVLCIAASASAYDPSYFNKEVYSITNLKTLTSPPKSSTGKNWHIEWGSAANMESYRRAVVRVHAGYNAASATWVYSTKSSAYHPYKTGYGNGGAKVELRGRLDNRDGDYAPIILQGYFFQ